MSGIRHSSLITIAQPPLFRVHLVITDTTFDAIKIYGQQWKGWIFWLTDVYICTNEASIVIDYGIAPIGSDMVKTWWNGTPGENGPRIGSSSLDTETPLINDSAVRYWLLRNTRCAIGGIKKNHHQLRSFMQHCGNNITRLPKSIVIFISYSIKKRGWTPDKWLFRNVHD